MDDQAIASTDLDDVRAAMRRAKHWPEPEALSHLQAALAMDDETRAKVMADARKIVVTARRRKAQQGTLDAFLEEFGLDNDEGIALMCLAEALLRVPDSQTQNELIAEKIRTGDWAQHMGHSENPFVNAGAWGLMLTGEVLGPDEPPYSAPQRIMGDLLARAGEPVIRRALQQAMKLMGRQFVFGRNIQDALKRRAKQAADQRLFSFDMLGEGARTAAAADRYLTLYGDAIEAVGQACATEPDDPAARSSISIKLSALHPRYEQTQEQRVMQDLLPRLSQLAGRAKHHGIQLTIDAEEADRLDLSLSLFQALAAEPALQGWNGLGLAVQAYQKRAIFVIDWLKALARQTDRIIPVRLVKGAYWDTEIKHAQVEGRPGYPVFTRKAATDVSYLTCAAQLLACTDRLYPQFATHNAHSLAAILHMAPANAQWEFQRLHGMGQLLYQSAGEALGEAMGQPLRARIYAPVGQHADLLPYLVRRLLENGANSSFVNQFLDTDVPVDEVVSDPLAHDLLDQQADAIPLPKALYGTARPNSAGMDLSDPLVTEPLIDALETHGKQPINASCLVGGRSCGQDATAILSPVDRRITVGTATMAGPDDREQALAQSIQAQPAWDRLGGAHRATILRRMADALEADKTRLLPILAREAGKILADGVAEIREAADFCRYYAAEAERHFAKAVALAGPTGESNELRLHGRGTFLCISPWNFPLAIFTGQVAAALAAGNAVIAKPAEQTPLIAHEAVRLYHRAGVPADVLHLLLGDGPGVAAPLVADERIAGVAFTGSTTTAKHINRALAARQGAIVPLIAETGGQNAMVVDSTALAEQVVDDVLMSAFGSAGQRCSACRVLIVHEKIAPHVLSMLAGALSERRLGDPEHLDSDIGPIIDEAAQSMLDAHLARMDQEATLLARADGPAHGSHGVYVRPAIYEIPSLALLKEEVFGPVLHVIRYKGQGLPKLMEELTATGYGLTFGVHSRLERRWHTLYARSRAGNVYVNRNMIGAVVGVQPFGGAGLSGTGPKAGGPHYLPRFAHERVITVNTAAIGGDTALFQGLS